jgi:hypothetical protein
LNRKDLKEETNAKENTIMIRIAAKIIQPFITFLAEDFLEG